MVDITRSNSFNALDALKKTNDPSTPALERSNSMPSGLKLESPKLALTDPKGGSKANRLRDVFKRGLALHQAMTQQMNDMYRYLKTAREKFESMRGEMSEEKAKEFESDFANIEKDVGNFSSKDHVEKYNNQYHLENGNSDEKRRVDGHSESHDKVSSEIKEDSKAEKSKEDEHPVMSGGDLERKSKRGMNKLKDTMKTAFHTKKGGDKTEKADAVESPSTPKDEVQSKSDGDKTEKADKTESSSTPKEEAELKADGDKKEEGEKKFDDHPSFGRIQSVIREELDKLANQKEKTALQAAALEAFEMENSLSSMRQKMYMHLMERISKSMDALGRLG